MLVREAFVRRFANGKAQLLKVEQCATSVTPPSLIPHSAGVFVVAATCQARP